MRRLLGGRRSGLLAVVVWYERKRKKMGDDDWEKSTAMRDRSDDAMSNREG